MFEVIFHDQVLTPHPSLNLASLMSLAFFISPRWAQINY